MYRSSWKPVDLVRVADNANQRITVYLSTLRNTKRAEIERITTTASEARGADPRADTRTSETRKRRGIVHLITNSIKMNASSETNSTYLH